MALFGKQHFKSPNESAEMAYKLGVLAVSAKEYQAAYEFFNKAAEAEKKIGLRQKIAELTNPQFGLPL